MILTDLELALAGQKIEVILYVRELADPTFHTNWIKDNKREMYYVLDFFLNDLCLPESDSTTDDPWFRPKEFACLSELAKLLGAIATDLRGSVEDSDFLAHPLWPAVVESAQICLSVMLGHGE